jgi:hypothetical protein
MFSHSLWNDELILRREGRLTWPGSEAEEFRIEPRTTDLLGLAILAAPRGCDKPQRP